MTDDELKRKALLALLDILERYLYKFADGLDSPQDIEKIQIIIDSMRWDNSFGREEFERVTNYRSDALNKVLNYVLDGGK